MKVEVYTIIRLFHPNFLLGCGVFSTQHNTVEKLLKQTGPEE